MRRVGTLGTARPNQFPPLIPAVRLPAARGRHRRRWAGPGTKFERMRVAPDAGRACGFLMWQLTAAAPNVPDVGAGGDSGMTAYHQSKVDRASLRRYRLDRIRRQLRQRDYGGAVLFDPPNIRHATDVANMQVWALHNKCRYVYVATEGPVILFDYGCARHLSEGYKFIAENPHRLPAHLFHQWRPASRIYRQLGEGSRRPGAPAWRRQTSALPWTSSILPAPHALEREGRRGRRWRRADGMGRAPSRTRTRSWP